MGVRYVAIGVGTETVPPTLLAAFRFDVSASVLLTYAFLTGRWRLQTTADVLVIVVLGELVLAGTVGFLFAGQRYTTASIAAVIMGLGTDRYRPTRVPARPRRTPISSRFHRRRSRLLRRRDRRQPVAGRGDYWWRGRNRARLLGRAQLETRSNTRILA